MNIYYMSELDTGLTALEDHLRVLSFFFMFETFTKLIVKSVPNVVIMRALIVDLWIS